MMELLTHTDFSFSLIYTLVIFLMSLFDFRKSSLHPWSLNNLSHLQLAFFFFFCLINLKVTYCSESCIQSLFPLPYQPTISHRRSLLNLNSANYRHHLDSLQFYVVSQCLRGSAFSFLKLYGMWSPLNNLSPPITSCTKHLQSLFLPFQKRNQILM